MYFNWFVFTTVLAQSFPRLMASLDARNLEGSLTFAGPKPHGWTTSDGSNVDQEAALAIDLGQMYEIEITQHVEDIYKDGIRDGQTLTLQNIGLANGTYSRDPLFNYNSYVFRNLEVGQGGLFDDQPAEHYLNTIVMDLFDIDVEDSSAPSQYVRGIEKEAALILNVWMRCYHHIYEVVRICGMGNPDGTMMLEELDKAAALWIGRLQVYDDSTRGTMLYNLAERSALNFGQDFGEAPVNFKIIKSMNVMRSIINEGGCIDDNEEGYKSIYLEMNKIIGQMIVPIVQNYIHYASKDVGDINGKALELYSVAIFPQIVSCDNSYHESFYSRLIDLSNKDYTELEGSILQMQEMYNCLGISCDDVGAHFGGIMCEDHDFRRVKLAGYQSESYVQNYADFDRDVNQINLLLREGNSESAFELYKFGRNSANITVRSLAMHSDFDDLSTNRHRLYMMYERYYANEGGTNFADELISNSFKSEPFQTIPRAKYFVPIYIKAVIAPQYAIRSLFHAHAKCESDMDGALRAWDQGVAVLVGSIEGNEITGNMNNYGQSWFSLSKQYCHLFDCGDGDAVAPSVNVKMIDHLAEGRRLINLKNCNAVVNKVELIESLLVTPLLQGALYHTYQRAVSQQQEENFPSAFAFGKAIMPFLQVNIREDNYLENRFFEDDGEFEATAATDIWLAIMLSLDDLGVDCKDLGSDTLGLLQKDASFCDLSANMTHFPTPVPQPTVAPKQTDFPTPSPTRIDIELDIEILQGYSFNDLDAANNQARIALDVRDFSAQRLHVLSEKEEAEDIYNNGKYAKPLNLKKFGQHDEIFKSEDPIYNFYRDAFRNDPLFEGVTSDNLDSPQATLVDTYAHVVVADSLANSKDIELASESILVMTIYMKIVHTLSNAIDACKNSSVNGAQDGIDSALAYYIGVGQTKADTNGYLFYSFAQRAASIFGTQNGNGEAKVNNDIIGFFIDAKSLSDSCSADNYLTFRTKVEDITRAMNVPLVQYLYHLLEEAEYDTKESNYLILFGLAVLPHMKTCQPTQYRHLSKEITEGGRNLDPAKVEDLLSIFKESYSCYGITCEDVHGENDDACLNYEQDKHYAGFSSISDVSKRATMDRDLLKIVALLLEEANESALEYYKNGYSSNFVQHESLQKLAQDQGISPNYNPYYNYYSNVDELVINVIEGNAPFEGLDVDSRSIIVLRIVQSMLFVQAGIHSFYKAYELDCEEGKFDYWDQAVAYLIGSVEGPEFGGDTMKNGVSIYGLAKIMCGHFDVCTTTENARANDQLMLALTKGQDLLSGRSCADLKRHIEAETIPAVLISLIQATIYYTENERRYFRKDILGKAIVPFIKQDIDVSTALKIEKITDLNNGGVHDPSNLDYGNVTAALEVFSYVIHDFHIGCLDVSENPTRDLCEYDYDDGTYELSDGLYVTTTFVEGSARIAEDVKEIKSQFTIGDYNEAKSIYQNGLYSEIYDSSGKRIGKQNLAGFSTVDSDQMISEPVFNLYRYTLKDVYKGNEKTYADQITVSFFESDFVQTHGNELAGELAAEASVALNLWGAIVHKLYATLELCENNDFTSLSDAIHRIDEAVAFWIGSTQKTGDKVNGHLLYRLAEESGDLFETVADNGQSRANKYALMFFKEAALELSFQGGCVEGSSYVTSQLRVIIENIVTQMTIPLIQHLIHNLIGGSKGHTERVKIYAHAVVPLLASCNAETFEFLKDKLLVSTYESKDIDEIIRKIQSTYSCLDLKCNDIGKTDGMPSCVDREDSQMLGEYSTKTDVREHSDIDLDIRFIEIMLTMDAIEAAKDVYANGKHARDGSGYQTRPLSLRYLATNVGRRAVPSFNKFEEFYKSDADVNYAHGLITKVFDLPNISLETRTTLIVSTLQSQVMYMASLQKFYESVEKCNSRNEGQYLQARSDWDTGAAYLFGSMQKKSAENNGYLLYAQSRKVCKLFNTCDSVSGEALNNVNILLALFAGAFLIDVKSCEALASNVIRIEKELQVPLIQETISAAFSKRSALTLLDTTPAKGYVYSRAILPYIHHIDTESADTIGRKMDLNVGLDVDPSAYSEVSDAFANAVSKMNFDCKDIGVFTQTNQGICQAAQQSGSSFTRSYGISAAFSISITLWLLQ